jgi:hypothetical protein
MNYNIFLTIILKSKYLFSKSNQHILLETNCMHDNFHLGRWEV